MAMSFDALLRIKADVQGEGAVQGLATKLGGLNTTADRASTGFKGLAGSVGGLIPGLQALIPMATGAGLVALATNAINAADNLNDMRQKTGVSVERLSQLQQAAEKSGITIEDVSRALVKYNRGIVDGKAGEALKDLGISATDASGRMKSADQILLEVADKFAKMPDGATKTAAAIKLFGRAGADMIPMLNGGSESIKGLAVTMTGEFASAADQFNDKMVELRTGLARVGVGIGTALMPFLLATTDAITGMVGAFSALPGPIQNVVAGAALLGVALLALAPAISAVISIAGAFAGLQIGATIAGWAGAIGPAIAAISAAFTGFLAFLTGTVLPGLLAFFSGPVGWTVLAVVAVVAMAVAFREPISKFLNWLTTSAWPALTGGFNKYVVEPLKAVWSAAVDALTKAASSFGEKVGSVWSGISKQFSSVVIAPIKSAWSALVGTLTSALNTARGTIESIWSSISKAFTANLANPIRNAWGVVTKFLATALQAYVSTVTGIWDAIFKAFNASVVAPIKTAWTALTAALPAAMQTARGLIISTWNGISKSFTDYVAAPIQATWKKVSEFLPAALSSAAKMAKGAWDGVVNTIKSAFSGVLQAIGSGINAAIRAVNTLIAGFNKLPVPDIKFIPSIAVPKFAEGGYVTRPTLGLIGEANEPEYVVPRSKARTFAGNIMAGRTGQAALSGGGGGTGRAPVINITTGPVRQVGSEQLVTLADLEGAVRQATRQVYATLRTPDGRRALGVA